MTWDSYRAYLGRRWHWRMLLDRELQGIATATERAEELSASPNDDNPPADGREG